jgi:hypothetical protein
MQHDASLSSAAVRTVITTGDKSKSDALGGAPQSRRGDNLGL